MILLVIIFAPVLLFLGVGLITKRFRNPWRLYMIFGKKGSGKSTMLVKLAMKYIRKGYVVYTNMADLLIQDARLIDVNDLGDFVPEANSLLLIDEAGTLWDNRNYKNFKPSLRDFWAYQRHYKVICYLASQSWDVDKKIRDRTDGMYLCSCILNVIAIARRITMQWTLTESTSEAESRIAQNLKFAPIWYWHMTYIPKYAKYFDSYNLPDLPKISYTLLSGFNVCKKTSH